MALEDFSYKGNLALCRKDTEGTTETHPCDPRHPLDFYFYETYYNDGKDSDLIATQNYTLINSSLSTAKYATLYDFKSIRPGTWKMFYMKETAKSIGKKTLSKEEIHVNDSKLEFTIDEEGGVYEMFIRGNRDSVRAFEKLRRTLRD